MDKTYFLNDKVYNVLKWVGLIVLPACATAWQVIAQVWSLPYGTEVATTLTAVGTLIGAVIGVSQVTSK